MTPQTFPLKQTPFIAVVVPEGAIEPETDLSKTLFWYKDNCRHYAKECPIVLPPGPWSIVITSVRKAEHSEAKLVVPLNSDGEYPDYESKKLRNKETGEVFDTTCYQDPVLSLKSLMTASMPEGMLWMNPYGEYKYEPYPYSTMEPRNFGQPTWEEWEQRAKDHYEQWHAAQSKVVGDAVILKQG